jgi:hypothetical protein
VGQVSSLRRILRLPLIALGLAVAVGITALHAQRSFREYPGLEYNDFPLPADYNQPSEWTFARLMYPQYGGRGYRNDWREGNSMWTQDYPRADRHFLQALRRLTRINARSVEQPVNLDDDDDVYNWPWLYAVQPGTWNLTDRQARKLRDFLDRGGFFMCDDFWGPQGWDVFMQTFERIFPDRRIINIDDKDPIFHIAYDLDNRYQVPGARYRYTGVTEKCDGCPPAWRAVYDDRGRIVFTAVFDSDLGDSWEWADDPSYEERFSALGIRIGVNYILYAMTH